MHGRSLVRHWFEPNERRLNKIMAAHLQEAAIVVPFLTREDRLHRRVRIHCPRTNGGQFPLSQIPRVHVPLKKAKARSCAWRDRTNSPFPPTRKNWVKLNVQGDFAQADAHAERRAALDMIHHHSQASTRRLTLGAE